MPSDTILWFCWSDHTGHTVECSKSCPFWSTTNRKLGSGFLKIVDDNFPNSLMTFLWLTSLGVAAEQGEEMLSICDSSISVYPPPIHGPKKSTDIHNCHSSHSPSRPALGPVSLYLTDQVSWVTSQGRMFFLGLVCTAAYHSVALWGWTIFCIWPSALKTFRGQRMEKGRQQFVAELNKLCIYAVGRLSLIISFRLKQTASHSPSGNKSNKITCHNPCLSLHVIGCYLREHGILILLKFSKSCWRELSVSNHVLGNHVIAIMSNFSSKYVSWVV